MIFNSRLPEYGWLIEFNGSSTCLGLLGLDGRIAAVPFSDPSAIRFKRKQDAESMLTALRSLTGHALVWSVCVVTHHSWA